MEIEYEQKIKEYRDRSLREFVITSLFGLGVASVVYYFIPTETQPKILQIRAVYDRDSIPCKDTIELEDGRTFQIEDRGSKLSLLEKSLEKTK